MRRKVIGFLTVLTMLVGFSTAGRAAIGSLEKHQPPHRHILMRDESGGVICKAMSLDALPEDVGVALSRSRSSGPSVTVKVQAASTWEVTYNGFTPEAQAAFQRAVEIWAQYIVSPTTIRVNANFEGLGPEGPLGSAGPDAFFKDPSQTDPPLADTYIPSPLVDALRGQDAEPGFPDIGATFNSEFQGWYFGLDGKPEFEQWDFLSVVLHELGHGLGFVASFSQEPPAGPINWGLESSSGPTPVVFDRFVVTGATGTDLLDTTVFPNGSPELSDASTGNDVFFDGLFANEAASNQRVPLYAPNPWEEASSISHLNEFTFPLSNSQGLMTPLIFNGEVQHEPGKIALAMMRDMGWKVLDLLYFAQFADGAGIASDIVVTNPSLTQSATVSVAFFDLNGVELDPSGFMQSGVTDIVIPSLGSLTLSSRGVGNNLVQGSAVVTSDRPVFGVIRFEIPGTGVAGVGSSIPAKEVALPVRRQGNLRTGAAIRNLTQEQIRVEALLLRDDGSDFTQAEIVIEALGRNSQFIDEIFTGVDTSSFAGTMLLTALTGRIAVIGLELEPGVRFTTLPVAPTRLRN